jgi:hypothetical protein
MTPSKGATPNIELPPSSVELEAEEKKDAAQEEAPKITE